VHYQSSRPPNSVTQAHSYRGTTANTGVFSNGMSISLSNAGLLSDEDENDKLNSLIEDYRRENERCS
jgi:hypothetical protein